MRVAVALIAVAVLASCGAADPVDPRAEEFAAPGLCRIIAALDVSDEAERTLAEAAIVDAGESLVIAFALSDDVVRVCERRRS